MALADLDRSVDLERLPADGTLPGGDATVSERHLANFSDLESLPANRTHPGSGVAVLRDGHGLGVEVALRDDNVSTTAVSERLIDRPCVVGHKHKSGSPVRYPAFDWIRLLLALEVVGMHLKLEVAGGPSWHPVPPVPSFLAISGIMIFGSWQSSRSPSHFWLKRAFRILPAFLASLLLVRLLFSWQEVGDVLKVWATGGILAVGSHNFPVWSLGCEELAYAGLALCCLLGLVTARTAMLAAIIFTSAYLILRGFLGVLPPQTVLQDCLPACFAIGIVSFYKPPSAYVAAITGTLLVFIGTWQYLSLRELDPFLAHFNALSVVLASIFVVNAGRLIDIPERFRIRRDISYGVYLYHYPILGYMAAQNVRGAPLVIGVFAASLVVAYVSSILIEGPAQRWRQALGL